MAYIGVAPVLVVTKPVSKVVALKDRIVQHKTDVEQDAMLPESLRRVLIAHGKDPNMPSVKSAESWSPASRVDMNDPQFEAETEELVSATRERLGLGSIRIVLRDGPPFPWRSCEPEWRAQAVDRTLEGRRV
jgi:hypothetical protein